MGVIFLILSMLAIAAMWWLSGQDLKATDDDRKKANFVLRIIRCLITLFFLWVLFGTNPIAAGYAFVPVLLIVPVSLALIWRSPISEVLSRGFHHLIDSDDRREFDPKQSARNLDAIANLLKSGKNEEALQLCEALKESGDANILVLETMLARYGIQFDSGRKTNPLADASNLRLAGKFTEAEVILNSLLAQNPANLDAALMLMRLYVVDLRRSDKAANVLRSLEKQSHIAPAHIEYARRSIQEWAKPAPEQQKVALPESVDELLKQGYFGTAIEILENKIREQPVDFDSWLKLIEAHGFYSGNHQRAGKLVKLIEAESRFTLEQIQLAKNKLEEWRALKAKPAEI